MQIKTTIWHHLTSTRMAEMWGLTIPVVSEDVEESELSDIADEKWFDSFFKS